MTERPGMFYVHSGKIDFKFILGLPAIILVSIVLSFVYSYAVVYIPIVGYLNFLLTLGFSFGVAFSAAYILKFSNSRNLSLSSIFGVIAGTFALYAAWVTFEFALVNRYSDEKIGLFLLAFQPAIVWDIACNIGREGWFSIKGGTPSGIVLWSFWGVEACCIIGVPAFITFQTIKDSVFCETCKKWADESKDLLAFTYKRESFLEKQLKQQNLSFLENVEAPSDGETSFYRIDCHHCQTCRKLFTLSLVKVSRSWNKDGKEETKENVLLHHLNIRQETFEALKQFAEGKGLPDKNEAANSAQSEERSPQPRPKKEAAKPLKRQQPERQAVRPSAPVEPSNESSSQKRYVMMFQGEIADGYQLEDVKKNVAALYKMPVSKCERMFSGEAVTIKKNLDYQTIQKYKRAFEKAGALCRIEESGN